MSSIDSPVARCPKHDILFSVLDPTGCPKCFDEDPVNKRREEIMPGYKDKIKRWLS